MSFGLQSEENEQSHMIARDAIQVRFGHYHLIQTSNFGYYRVSSDEISPLSQPTSQVDEMKISSGVSQSHVGDKLIEIVQYNV